jgi:hypothetical protein
MVTKDKTEKKAVVDPILIRERRMQQMVTRASALVGILDLGWTW